MMHYWSLGSRKPSTGTLQFVFHGRKNPVEKTFLDVNKKLNNKDNKLLSLLYNNYF
jgi:hypothetical protein